MSFRKFVGLTVIASGLRYTPLVKPQDFELNDLFDGAPHYDRINNTDFGLFNRVSYRENHRLVRITFPFHSYSRVNVVHTDKNGIVTNYPSKCPFGFGKK